MKLHFYGGAQVVTGVNYMLEVGKTKILIDCGLFQGRREHEKLNEQDFPYKPANVDYVLITHAHLDHIGRLPRLIEAGFTGKIFATGPTVDFARLMLEDSEKLLREKTVKADVIPLLDGNAIDKIMEMFEVVDYDKPFNLGKDIRVNYKDAGHVLGSACIEIESQNLPAGKAGKKIVFSGDLGSGQVGLIRKPAEIYGADYVVMESTYGDRLHEDEQSVKDIIEDIAEETIGRGGVLMIPSFALERTQQILFHLNDLIEHHRIAQVPIFVDSPLAIKLTRIYKKYSKYFNDETRAQIKAGDDIFDFPGLEMTESVKQSKAINIVEGSKIIIAGSGMSQGGRIIHHEVRYLPDAKNTLLLVTYQAEGTTGRKIRDGAKKIEIHDRMVMVKARVATIDGYSAHADQKGLINWLRHMIGPKSEIRPKIVFCCQGEEEPANELAQLIRDRLGLEARVPRLNQSVEL